MSFRKPVSRVVLAFGSDQSLHIVQSLWLQFNAKDDNEDEVFPIIRTVCDLYEQPPPNISSIDVRAVPGSGWQPNDVVLAAASTHTVTTNIIVLFSARKCTNPWMSDCEDVILGSCSRIGTLSKSRYSFIGTCKSGRGLILHTISLYRWFAREYYFWPGWWILLPKPRHRTQPSHLHL